MAGIMRALAMLVLVQMAHGQFQCPNGWVDKASVPKCAQATSQSCSKETCCDKTRSCSEFQVGWILAQLATGGCMKDGAKQFFDTKKASNSVAAPSGEAQVKAACCTNFADAKCSDWAKGGCGIGFNFQDVAAPPDNANGKTISDAKYKELCCVAIPNPPKTCSTYQVLWIAAALIGGGCSKDNAKQFFDLKKAASVVAEPAGDAEVASACCTNFAEAKCIDWLKGGCGLGFDFKKDAAAPADGDGKALSAVKYKELCCEAIPKKCSDYQVLWIAAQLGGAGGCHTGGATQFFDNKKLASLVANTGAEADVKAACCTDYKDAKCSDWVKVCSTGTFVVPTNAASADGSKTLTQNKFQSSCCTTPMSCKDWSTDVDVAKGHTLSIVTFAAVLYLLLP